MREYYYEKVAVVTGAASGIGLAVTELMIENGATVFLADFNADALSAEVDRLNARTPGKAIGVRTDVTKQPEVAALVEQAAEHAGHLDFLFNNAGAGLTMPFEDITLEIWEKVINLNLWGVIYGIHSALPIMRKQGFGHIVNTSSIAGIIPPPYQTVYCATKYGVTGIGECLRYEMWDEGIRFSTVCPGNVATNIFKAAGAVPADAVSAEQAAQWILEGVANNDNLIIFPPLYKDLYRQFSADPEALEQAMIQMSRDRHEAYRTTGRYF